MKKALVLVRTMLLLHWGPGSQNTSWQGLSLPICEMGILGPGSIGHLAGLWQDAKGTAGLKKGVSESGLHVWPSLEGADAF